MSLKNIGNVVLRVYNSGKVDERKKMQSQHHNPEYRHEVEHGPHRQEVAPTPVVKVLSPHGVLYVMMTISLFVVATGLALTLVFLSIGQVSLSSLALPISMTAVGLPFFAFLFLHLKKQELLYPELKLDHSKRFSTQWSQIISFTVILVTLIATLVCLFATMGGAEGLHAGKVLACAFFTLVIFSGLLAYYWQDERMS